MNTGLLTVTLLSGEKGICKVMDAQPSGLPLRKIKFKDSTNVQI